MSVRVRFAPSPTGLLHVGALRTAVFDHLFARRHGGANILRIEDTDRSRFDPVSEREFVESLRWAGIEFDEGPHVGGPHAPYRQSERAALGVYDEHVRRLLAEGHAYKAFETPEELEEMRLTQQVNRMPSGYFGGAWRDASRERVAEEEAKGTPYVLRQKVPRGRTLEVEDAIRGRIAFETDTLPDPVLLKADGMPTYHLAATVDDHLMEITHVLRGEEWISSFPLHWLLYEQLGWERPVFVHCPVIVGADGKKLSKRHGATRVLDYAALGFLSRALRNFVALIGWSPGDEREVMSEAELTEAFSLEGLQSSPGRFDVEKLRWLNGAWIRRMPPEELVEELLAYVALPATRDYFGGSEERPPDPEQLRKLDLIAAAAQRDRGYVLAALREEQERVQTLAEFGDALEFFLVEEPPMDPKAVEKWLRADHVAELFEWILAKLAQSKVETPEHYESILRGYQTHKGLEKLGPVVHPTRVALTGKTAGPGLFELMAVLGPERIERRLRRAMGR